MKKESYIKKFFKTWKNFGIKIAFGDLKDFFYSRLGQKEKAHYKKHDRVKRYLRHNYGYIIDKYKNMKLSDIGSIQYDSPIWVFWWQGIENCPSVVKNCIDSIIKFSGDRKVIIVDKKNYENFVKIESYIIEKLNEGKITLTHFSDILRFNLLYKHGGIWLDSTLFLTDELPRLDNYKIYTIKHGHNTEWHVSKGKWCGFMMACNKNNPFMAFGMDLFNEYWKNEDMLICYLLIDCVIAIAYENIPYISEMFDNVPYNNQKFDYFAKIANSSYNEKIYLEALSCGIHKLSYKEHFTKEDNGLITNYGKLIENFLG